MLRHPRPISTRAKIAGAVAGAFVLLVYGPFAPVSSAGARCLAAGVGAGGHLRGPGHRRGVLGARRNGCRQHRHGHRPRGRPGAEPSGVIAGFPPGTTQGTIHDKDAAAEQAQSDRQDAYDAAAAQTSTGTFAGDQAGSTFKPGVYTSAAAITNTGTMTLDADGDSSAVFVFQIGAAFSSAAASKIVLTDGALANNVYWQVAGAVVVRRRREGRRDLPRGGCDLLRRRRHAQGSRAHADHGQPGEHPGHRAQGRPGRTRDHHRRWRGTLRQRHDAGDLRHHGRAGRSAADRHRGGQTLATTVGAGGVWSVGAATLTEGDHQVVAAISDASQNTSSVTQVLTVDVDGARRSSIDGAADRATNDTTPVITGTTDAASGTPVAVTVGGQTLTTTDRCRGAWTVTPHP